MQKAIIVQLKFISLAIITINPTFTNAIEFKLKRKRATRLVHESESKLSTNKSTHSTLSLLVSENTMPACTGSKCQPRDLSITQSSNTNILDDVSSMTLRFPLANLMARPSTFPTNAPSNIPSGSPSLHPSLYPSTTPSLSPSIFPSGTPSKSINPSAIPSSVPSTLPTSIPTSRPSFVPSESPSHQPTSFPTLFSSIYPTSIPTSFISEYPTLLYSSMPTAVPSFLPSSNPVWEPSSNPSDSPYPSVELLPEFRRNTFSDTIFVTMSNFPSESLSEYNVFVYESSARSIIEEQYEISYKDTKTKVLSVDVTSQDKLIEVDDQRRNLQSQVQSRYRQGITIKDFESEQSDKISTMSSFSLRQLQKSLETDLTNHTIFLSTRITVETTMEYATLISKVGVDAINSDTFLTSLRSGNDELFQSISIMADAKHDERYINSIKGMTEGATNSQAIVPMIAIIIFAVGLTLSMAGFVVWNKFRDSKDRPMTNIIFKSKSKSSVGTRSTLGIPERTQDKELKPTLSSVLGFPVVEMSTDGNVCSLKPAEQSYLNKPPNSRSNQKRMTQEQLLQHHRIVSILSDYSDVSSFSSGSNNNNVS